LISVDAAEIALALDAGGSFPKSTQKVSPTMGNVEAALTDISFTTQSAVRGNLVLIKATHTYPPSLYKLQELSIQHISMPFTRECLEVLTRKVQ